MTSGPENPLSETPSVLFATFGGVTKRREILAGECASAPLACPADLDGNGHVAFPDLSALLSNWG